MAKGYVLIAIPVSGLFIQGNHLEDGNGVRLADEFTLNIRPDRKEATKAKRRLIPLLEAKFGTGIRVAILPVEYAVMKEEL
jgi:hypothetical protein